MRDRQQLVNEIAGLLSTIEFRPASGHPIAMDTYANQVVSTCEAGLVPDLGAAWDAFCAVAKRYEMDQVTGEFPRDAFNHADELGVQAAVKAAFNIGDDLIQIPLEKDDG